MLSEEKQKDLEKQGYRLAGRHSAVKVCHWCRKNLIDQGTCYKHRFYGINSHRCVQMTPSLPFCSLRCCWCWRDIEHTSPKWRGPADSPKKIVDECIKEHVKLLQGFGGNKKCNMKKFSEANKPIHFAISLAGEPTLYPQLPELIKELDIRGISSFLVTNATNPEMLKKLKNTPPTQLYITLPAPNETTFRKMCSPLIKNGWQKILESLRIMKELKPYTRTTIRLTLAKHKNMTNPEQYAELIRIAEPKFVELKAYVWMGYSKTRMEIKNMPRHHEIKEFSEQLAKHLNYKFIDEQPASRVVLLMKHEDKNRKMKF